MSDQKSPKTWADVTESWGKLRQALTDAFTSPEFQAAMLALKQKLEDPELQATLAELERTIQAGKTKPTRLNPDPARRDYQHRRRGKGKTGGIYFHKN